jgi:23S rRNA (pseudouridine1915-N3)-methyltransferase
LQNPSHFAIFVEDMRMILLTVGKTDVAWVREGLSLYAARLAHYVPFSLVEIPQLKNVSALSKEQIKEREGELILKNVKPADRVILLDERGRELRSMAFAAEIGDHLSREGRDLVFVIGGAYGFSKAVYARADGMLSLSKMTFSHQMVRTVFAEQLYRAFTILKGEPYHHAG